MKNFTNRNIDNFNYIGKINIEDLKKKIQTISDSDWEDFDWRQKTFNVHKTTQTIPLIYDKDFRENNLTYWKHYDITKTFLNKLENKFKKIISDGFIVRAILVKLKANTNILPHTDNLKTLDNNNRFHIPIITNKKVLFTVGDEVKNLKEGEVWEINNGQKSHSVINDSDKDRVHLIVDWIKYDDYIIKDNFFYNPDDVRKFALSQNFYEKKNHPSMYGVGGFPGYRTDYFDDTSLDIYRNIHDLIIPHVSKLENVKHPSEKYTRFKLQISFSYTLKQTETFRHIDKIAPGYKVRYGGLVYLHPNPPKKSGTTLYLKNNTYLDNKYNRFVMYNSNIEHEPTDNFGTDINNSRLVLTIFYDMA